MRIRAELDTTPLERALKAMGRAGGRRVLKRAIVGGTRAMEREAVARAYTELNLKKRDVRKAIKRSQARSARTSGTVSVRARPVPLIAFGARQTRRGVSLKIERGGKRFRLRHSFIATMPSGHRGVFERDIRKTPRRGPPPHRSGLPIRELFGKQVIQTMREERVQRRILHIGERTFVSELQRLVDVEMAKR